MEKLKQFTKDMALGKLNEYSTQIASHDYCQLELEYAYKKAGSINNAILTEDIKLVDEKDNKYDPKAIAIYVFNVKIGYVPADETDFIRSLKHKQNESVRLYFYNEKYRSEYKVYYRSNTNLSCL